MILCNQNDIKNLIFLYDKKAMIDILRFMKIEIHQHQITFTNLYQNHVIFNTISIENPHNLVDDFMCYIEDVEQIFSVLSKDSEVVISYDKDSHQLIISNEGSTFYINALSSTDFIDIQYKQQLPSHSFKLYDKEIDIKNILINSSNDLSEYIAFKITHHRIYIFNTDNRRIHSFYIENEGNLPNNTFVLPNYFIDYLIKYKFTIYYDIDGELVFQSDTTRIVMSKKEIIEEFNKAFNYLQYIQKKTYFNTFKVNKHLFLEELKKHAIIDKDIYIHLKPNAIVLYSKNDKMDNRQIKTISHGYDVQLKEHQSVLINVKYLIDFIKSHKDTYIIIYTNIKYNLLFSKNNLCATKRM